MERRRGWGSGDGAPRDERGGWKKAEIGSSAAMQRRISAEDESKDVARNATALERQLGAKKQKGRAPFLGAGEFC